MWLHVNCLQAAEEREMEEQAETGAVSTPILQYGVICSIQMFYFNWLFKCNNPWNHWETEGRAQQDLNDDKSVGKSWRCRHECLAVCLHRIMRKYLIPVFTRRIPVLMLMVHCFCLFCQSDALGRESATLLWSINATYLGSFSASHGKQTGCRDIFVKTGILRNHEKLVSLTEKHRVFRRFVVLPNRKNSFIVFTFLQRHEIWRWQTLTMRKRRRRIKSREVKKWSLPNAKWSQRWRWK